MPILHYPATEADWHRLRHGDVTSTEAAALFGLSPYSTAYELAVQKQDEAPPTWEDNERMFWGRMHERTIAKVIGLRYGVKVRRLSAYARHDIGRMGASFDYEIVGIGNTATNDPTLQNLYVEHGPGILECKNVDAFIYSRQWKAGKDESEAPAHIEIQVQHQLEVIGRQWSVLAALVGGNRLEKMIRLRDTEVGAAIRTKISGFWADLGVGKMPPIELPEDADIICKLNKYAEPGKLLDARNDVVIRELCEAYAEAGKREREASDDKKSAKARLLLAIGDAETVLVDGYSISAGTVGPAEIPAYTREGYRGFRVTVKKPKKESVK